MNNKNQERKCKLCGRSLEGKPYNAKFCNKEICRNIFYFLEKVAKSHEKYNLNNTDDWCECKICGLRAKNLNTHLIPCHGTNVKEYEEIFNEKPFSKKYLNNCSERVKGKNNPGYQHGGKFSPFSKKFVKGDVREKTLAKVKETKKNPIKRGSINIWYQLHNFTNANWDLAQSLLSERQTTFSLEKCIEKYGEEEGKERWRKRQEKWQSNYKKTNFSKVSQELFWEIVDNIGIENIQFAELKNGKADFSGKCNEAIISNKIGTVRPDFLYKNKVIEFDGDYWHSERVANPKREQKRQKVFEYDNYEVLHIKENDWNRNKLGVLNTCINYLKK